MSTITTPHPTLRLLSSEIDLCRWIGRAAPGDVLEYHRGFLARDTTPHRRTLPERDRAELSRLARRAWWASERSLVHLVQRRHGAEDYSYMAIARPIPKPARTCLSSLLLAEAA